MCAQLCVSDNDSVNIIEILHMCAQLCVSDNDSVNINIIEILHMCAQLCVSDNDSVYLRAKPLVCSMVRNFTIYIFQAVCRSVDVLNVSTCI